MRIDARHWTVAGATALGLHAAVVVMLFQLPPHPAASLGGGGSMQISLAPAAGPSAAETPTGRRQDAAAVTPAPTLAATPPPAETPTRPNAEPVEIPKAETVEPVRAAAVPPPLPGVARVPTPEPVQAQDVQPPPPRARPQPRPDETKASDAPPASGPVSAASEIQGQTGQLSAGGQPAQRSHSGAPTTVASASGGVADYMSQLRAWLEQHKEYPSRARRRRIEGTALLVFVMDRGGNVLSHRIERSAGDPSLDTAVAEMIERAQPLPRIPESFEQARLEVRVPVQFLLR